MRQLLKSIWSWLKKNWKWVLFPVGLLLVVFTALQAVRSHGRDEEPTDLPDPEKPVIDVIDAVEERDQKLAELEQKHRDRIQELAEDQRKELEELKDKPTEEIVRWFDNLQ